MKSIKIKILASVCLFVVVFIFGAAPAAFAQTQEIVPFPNEELDTGIIPCDGVETECGVCQIFQLVSNIVYFATFIVAAPLGALMLIYGGIKVLTSGGNEKEKSKGTGIIWSAVWGLVITFAAWVIINAILGALANKSFSESWYSFPGCPSVYQEDTRG